MTNTAHTPTPWKETPRVRVHGDEPYEFQTPSLNGDGDYIGTAYKSADAAHIVACVNAHDALTARVAELEAALRDSMACMSSLRDFVAEGGSRTMIGATQAVLDADAAYDKAYNALAKP